MPSGAILANKLGLSDQVLFSYDYLTAEWLEESDISW